MFSIITVNYNNAALTATCVEKTCVELDRIGARYEVIIVDNHSIDNSLITLQQQFQTRQHIKIVHSGRNGGFGFGNNMGVRHSQYPILWFLNSDAWCIRATDLGHLATLVQQDDTGCVSNIMRDADGTVHPNGGAQVSFRYFVLSSFRLGQLYRRHKWIQQVVKVLFRRSSYIQAGKHDTWDTPKRAQVVSGASFFMEARKYQLLNGFDEHFFLYDEDTDLCYRAALQGWKNYVTPYLEVATINHSTTSKMNRLDLKRIKLSSRLYFYKKHFSPIPRVVLALIARLTWKQL